MDDDDDSDDNDLMSSGDDRDSGEKKKSADKVAKEVIEKASFQTALDIPEDDVKVVKAQHDQASPKAVEVIQVADDSKPKNTNAPAEVVAAAAADSKEAKKE